MSHRGPEQVAARLLQRETNAPYETCLNFVRVSIEAAEKLKTERPHMPFAACLVEVARPLIEEEF